jgi:hypothetical protein
LPEALALVETAAKRLWEPEGEAAVAYLTGRGLTHETVRARRLGWVADAAIPIDGGARTWRVSGVVLPWLDGDRLSMVKVRRLGSFMGAKYVEAYRDRPGIYPDPAVIEPGKPLIIVEGEFDALLLGQALGDLAAVVTLGSASNRPEAANRRIMRFAPSWFLAHDADPAGDKAASGWPARAVRVRPPDPYKDWTEAAVHGVNLARWWRDCLGWTEAPELFSWPELASWRWGDAVGDPEPGIVISQCHPRRRWGGEAPSSGE